MRLIDAEAAAEAVSERHGIPLAELVDTFGAVPTVDAVPVVRCRDCAHAYEHRGDWYCFALPSEDGLSPDAFCDRGTRRAE